MHLACGSLLDLLNPDPALIDLRDGVPRALAHQPRFAAQAPYERQYSVAQHCILGALALEQETGNPQLAMHFLLHDAHEAFIGDLTRPFQNALAMAIAQVGNEDIEPHPALLRAAEETLAIALNKVKRKLACAIYAAAHIAPPSAMERDQIHDMDMRMLRWERDHILTNPRGNLWQPDVETAEPIKSMCCLANHIWRPTESLKRWIAVFDDLKSQIIARSARQCQ